MRKNKVRDGALKITLINWKADIRDGDGGLGVNSPD